MYILINGELNIDTL